MAATYSAQLCNGRYSLQFETDDKDLYKMVEEACERAVDGEKCRRVYPTKRVYDYYNWENEFNNG